MHYKNELGRVMLKCQPHRIGDRSVKKIIIVTNNFDTGGVQKSLVNLLNEISNMYDITLFTFYARDGRPDEIPANVNVQVLKSSLKYLGMCQNDTVGKPFEYIARAFWVVLAKILGRPLVVRVMSLFHKKLKGYDCAISYLHEGAKKNLYGGCNQFVSNKIEAKQKIGWLHCDFKQCGANTAESKAIYSKFDKIVACSQGCKQAFVDCLPELENKCVAIRNCNDYKEISKLASNGIEYDRNFFNIVTVSRLSEEKGIERAIEAVRQCKANGHRIKYHIVGSGDMELKLKSIVAEAGLVSDVVFYGNKKNPYPYMVNADLFLLSSYHEAAPMVFDEAAFLGVPVLATATTSTQEMLEQTGYGFVCDNTIEGIVETLSELLTDSNKLNIARQSLADAEFGNCSSINQLNELLK